MPKLIRDVSELPDWFDIHNYEDWEDKDPHEATLAINNKFFTSHCLYAACTYPKESGEGREISSDSKKDALEQLALYSKDPFVRHWREIMTAIFHRQNKEYHGDECAEFYRMQEVTSEKIDEATRAEAKRIIGDGFPLPSEEKRINRVTLWDVMNWMDENKNLIEEIEQTAIRLSEENSWDLDEVRSSLQCEIPILSALDGTDFVHIDHGASTPEGVSKGIKEYLESLPTNQMDALPAKYSDVRKIFDYRIGAYLDLECWSYLTGSTITKKCYAQAMFPDGRYGELDMQPTRTVGRFIQRLRNGYIEDLCAKSSEMKTMQD